MLASISFNAGVVTVIGTSNDDSIVISGANTGLTDISINASQSDEVIQRFTNQHVSEILVYAGDGNDAIYSSSVLPTQLFGQNGNDLLNGGFADDLIYGNAGNDRLVGKTGDDSLFGSGGDDVIIAGSGDDLARGGAGHDTLSGNNGADQIFGDSGIDTVYGGNGNDIIFGGDSLDHLYGQGDDDEIAGGAGNDRIYGNNGNDQLLGEQGNDRLEGGAGDDYLNGGTQADTVFGNLGADVLAADPLDNFADLDSPDDRFEFDTNGGSVFSHVYADGTIDIIGTAADDTIRIYADRVAANGSNLSLNVAQAPLMRVFAGSGDDDVRQIGAIANGPAYRLEGGTGDDYLRGGFLSDILNGGTGNDQLYGQSGFDHYEFSGQSDLGFDVVVDSSGINTLDFSGLQIGVGIEIDLDSRIRQTVALDNGSNRRLDLLLSGQGTRFASVVGTGLNDTISGFIESAEGGLGDDRYRPINFPTSIVESAGQGFDVIDHSLKTAGTTIDLNSMPDAWLEKIVGTSFDDTIINNEFTQVVDGGNGNDTYEFSPASDYTQSIQVVEAANQGIDTVDYSNIPSAIVLNLTRFPDVENLIGTAFDDQLIGNAQDNQIFGGDGDDYIEGRGGIDDLQGQDGTDSYFIAPGEELGVTDVVTDDGPSIFLPESDEDGDGLLPSEESGIGTNPNEFDSDGDLLGDGFENASNNLDPNVANDPHGDSDGDGLTELQEQIYDTDPDSTDTDGDGTSDFDEIEQGGDPTDPTDEGEAPSDEDIVKLDLTVGDHSGSHSERYDLTVGKIHHQAPQFGVVATDDYTFKRGKKYDVRITHRGSRLTQPDYDYTAGIQRSIGEQRLVILKDPDDIIGVDETSHTFHARGKSATLYVPRVDLDVVLPNGSLVAEEDEIDAAETGYLFPALEDENQANGLTELKLAKVAAGLSGTSRLIFNTQRIRIWQDRQRTQQVVSGSTEFEHDQEYSLFVESYLNAQGHTANNIHHGYQNVQITAVFTPNDLPASAVVLGTTAEDRVLLRAIDSDLDIAPHEGDWLSETIEDNPGLEIDLGADKDELARLRIRSLIPDGLDYADDFFTLNFDTSLLKIWIQVTPELSGLDSLLEVTTETQFDESEKQFTLWVEAFEVTATSISLVWHESGTADATSFVFDSVTVTTVGLRDVDILLAIDGTGSHSWLDSGNPDTSPGGTGKTINGERWLSHTRNWADELVDGHYGDGEEDKFLNLDGPDAPYLFVFPEGSFGQDSPDIIERGYSWISSRYWEAVATGAEVNVDIIGMSRGGLIAAEIAWKIEFIGYRGGSAYGESSIDHKRVRYLGLLDPVDQADSVNEIREIPPNVQLGVRGYGTNFAGSDAEEISRWYWDRISYQGEVSQAFAATHSAFQGSPTYSTDVGRSPGKVFGLQNHPSAWLEGYTDERDVEGAIASDTWLREQARSIFVPIEMVDDYFFNVLHRDPNPESPNTDNGYGQ